MAEAITFDTLAYSKRMQRVGFTVEQADEQAEALAEIVEDKLSTKRDLKELEIRLTIKLGTIAAAGIVITAALSKIL